MVLWIHNSCWIPILLITKAFGKTIKFNIHQIAGFPQSTKTGTQEEKKLIYSKAKLFEVLIDLLYRNLINISGKTYKGHINELRRW